MCFVDWHLTRHRLPGVLKANFKASKDHRFGNVSLNFVELNDPDGVFNVGVTLFSKEEVTDMVKVKVKSAYKPMWLIRLELILVSLVIRPELIPVSSA